VAYSLQYAQDVRSFLCNLEGFDRASRVRLFTSLDTALRENGDVYLNDLTRRVSGCSSHFWFDLLVAAGGQFRHLWFAVGDGASRYGVLKIDYVEER
jgi:hypothetical protein